MTDEVQGVMAVPDPTPAAPVAPPVAAAPATSILDQLRERRAKIGAGAPPLDLDVPGYGGDLVVRYQWVPLEQLSRTASQLARLSDTAVQAKFAAADILVACCQQVMIRTGDGLLPIGQACTPPDPDPIRFDDRLTDALQLDNPGEARLVVLSVFKNEYAVIEQAEIVSAWLRDQGEKVDTDLAGE